MKAEDISPTPAGEPANLRDLLAVLTEWAISYVGRENVPLHPEVVQAEEALAAQVGTPLQLNEQQLASTSLLVARGLDDLNYYLGNNDPLKDGYSADEVQALHELQLIGPQIASMFEVACSRSQQDDAPAAPAP